MVFLHEDLVKLPTFPRKALEAELDLHELGNIGKVRKQPTDQPNPPERSEGAKMVNILTDDMN